jgi:protein ImuB
VRRFQKKRAQAQQIFAEPIGAAETIARYVAKLTGKLCEELELRGFGARRLDLLFGHVDNRVQAIRVGTAQPVRDVKRLTRLLCDKIEQVNPGFGIEIMRLAATAAEPFATRQTISSLIEEPEADVSGLIDILSNRGWGEPAVPVRACGERRSGTFGPADSGGGPGHRRWMARPLAPPSPVISPA